MLWNLSSSLFPLIIVFPYHVGRRIHCDTMKRVRQVDNLFVCFGAKPNKGLSSRSRRDRKWARERRSERSWKKEPREGSWRRVTQKGRRQQTAEESSRHEIGSRSSEGRPVKMSQHSSWLCGNFAKDARQC